MKKTVLAIFLFGCFIASGQKPERQRFSFGYSAGTEIQTLNIGVIRDNPADPYATPGRPGVGAGVGIWGQWTILPVLHFRSAFHLAYMANTIRFWSSDGKATTRNYPFAELELPAHFTLSNPLRHLPVKTVILFGGRISWNLAPNPAEAPIQILPERLGLDLGIGAGFTWGKWAIQPELIYSFGVNNIHNFTNSAYDWAVGRMLRDQISVQIVFGKKPAD